MRIDDLLQRLQGVRGSSGQYSARCPAHEDAHASLSIGVGKDGRVLLHCHAGCDTEAICEALGLTIRDLFVERAPSDVFPAFAPVRGSERSPVIARYTYPNGAEKLRRADKSFTWRQPDGAGGWTYNRKGLRPCLYVAGELTSPVFVVEGEKDADTLHAMGYNAVSGEDGAGAGKWRKEYTEQLRGLCVYVIGDHDDVGQVYASEICEALQGAAQRVHLLQLAAAWPEIPEHGDVSDMADTMGRSAAAERLNALAAAAPEWTPDPAPFRPVKAAADFPDANTKFLWYPYLPIGDYSVMMADGGTGKTLLCCKIAATVSVGGLFPGEMFRAQPADALIISAEDPGSILKSRLKKSGADLTRVKLIDCMDSVGMNIHEDYAEFAETVRRCAPALVIVDPWHAFLGEKIDISRVNAVRPVLQRLANIAKECECAMILVSHVNKRAQGENANNAATGSTDFVNAARSAFRVIFDGADEDARIAVHTKTNYAAYGKSVRYRIVDGGVEWAGFAPEITRATLEAAARHRQTPYEASAAAEGRNLNTALIEALKSEVNPFGPVRFSYEEFKQKHGELIFGGKQPKRALDAVRDALSEEGYFLRPCRVWADGGAHNGFEIRAVGNDVEPEQEELPEGPLIEN